jgi:hypothetical protein
MVKIAFERGNEPLIYKDALYFTEEEYAALSPEQIESMKDERYNRWYAIITTPPEEVIQTGDTNG